MAALPQLATLVKLDLRHNRLHSLAGLEVLQALRCLKACGNAGVRSIKPAMQLPLLEELWLTRTSVPPTDLAVLLHMNLGDDDGPGIAAQGNLKQGNLRILSLKHTPLMLHGTDDELMMSSRPYTHDELARWMLTADRLSKNKIGDYVGRSDDDAKKILAALVAP